MKSSNSSSLIFGAAELTRFVREKQTNKDKQINKDCYLIDKLNEDILYVVVSYVEKLKSSNSSSLIFGAAELEPVQAKNARHGIVGRSWQLSEETKQKIKDATNRDTEYLDILRKIKLEENYIVKTKTRAKQQYIDTRLQEVFGELSKTTLTKIRKLDTSN